jgi:DNA invertase Pin-like site-specific DNA recombinase
MVINAMVKKGRKGLSPEVIEEIRNLHEKGTPVKEIAKKLDLGVSTVYKHLKGRTGLIWKLKRKFGRE